ncbi:MAG: hypothetical protein RLZZ546_3274 [Bacteroidota bacterium]|jgi:hypothetical protein
MRKFFLFVFSALSCFLTAQNESSFIAKVSKDEVLMGNLIKVEFTLNNVKGKFEAPEFKHFDIISGPNTSSSMYVVNGKSTSMINYTYFLKPKKEGEVFIENAYIINEKDSDQNLETSPIKITVKSNPDGIIEEDEDSPSDGIFFSFPNQSDFFKKQPEFTQPKKEEIIKDKPKRKIKRI